MLFSSLGQGGRTWVWVWVWVSGSSSLSSGRLDRALDVGFLVLFDTLFRALVVVLMAFDVEGLFGGGLVIFFAGFLWPCYWPNTTKPTR